MLPSNNRRTLGHSYKHNSKQQHKQSHAVLSARNVVTFLAVAVPAFFLGTLSSLYTGVVDCSGYDHPHHAVVQQQMQQTGGLRPQEITSESESSASSASSSQTAQIQIQTTEADITARVADKVRSLQIEMQADQTVKVDALVEERLAVLMRQHNVNCGGTTATAAAAVTTTATTAGSPVDGDGDVNVDTDGPMMEKVNAMVADRMRLLQQEMDVHCGGGDKKESSSNSNSLWPVDKIGHFVSGMARTTKEAFTSKLDLGVPLDKIINGSSDVLMIYNNLKSLPHAMIDVDSVDGAGVDSIPDLSVEAAVENCDYLNVLLTHHTFGREQCIAIVPQYESYHLQKWMRIDPKGAVDKKEPLQMVSRGHQSNGRDSFNPPTVQDTHQQWDMLRKYLDSIHAVLDDLRPILASIALHNTVVVMVCNFGQSELLMNFVCAARARGFDISNILVFATDQETLDLAESIGLTAYFDQRNFGAIPTGAANRYGDAKFVAMMMAKVICVQVVSMLGYDMLFQDVDIVWYKNPLEYFHNSSSAVGDFDMFFQDDGGHSVRYAPYSANSGFYFVKYNARTRHFLTSLLMAGDLVLKTNSHQQALIALLSEHVSLYGLKAKVLSRDMEEFPGGYQFNQKSGNYMRSLFAGEIHPIIFHMSWTLNKDNKLLYFKQMGEWYVQEQCIRKTTTELTGDSKNTAGKDLVGMCCSAEPLVSCHYSDKPSVIPCRDSPTIDKGKRKSFW